ncbi:MAG: lipoyl(octanoyl) transferase LipB [Magnetococcales bacterium]|nr:lipoyl(octanoyl) transferase LipB [Magnetococcales bacterium]MBF0151214.1 lipoyl(octanoyl) transferase LipB [Magnetococcales bacterium]MBF0173073.1 lipoyl(octanoyl) transferase LipB [Magnetococcales bacterium]MBF0347241.1 lipoyl(octanoyl) transferase LipB [Magnetococcales bacterium]MBF0630154.1 lipoyl(octanoyl) transferase LipB [Magnetococcales bacterium]
MVLHPESVRRGSQPYDLMRPGRIDYFQALAMQQQRVETLINQGGPNLLILLEHPPVYTVGRSGKPGEVLGLGAGCSSIPVIPTDRGGRVTYHGPGQLVAYVIRDLRPDTGRVLDHVRRLEELVLRTLADFGIQGSRERINPGVWVGQEKIAALGVRIRRGITYHGIAINRDPDLAHFSGIIPCGIMDRGVTSMARLGCRVTSEALEASLLSIFTEVFDASLTPCQEQ